MTNGIRKIHGLWMLAAVAGRLWGADSASLAAKATAEAAGRQRQAVSAMAASLKAQRRSLQSHAGRMPASSFFTLPPLPPLPPLAPLPGSPIPFSEPVAACPPLAESELDALVDEAALREDLEPDLLRGVIRQESANRPCAVSRKGAMGLMQLMPATAFQLGVGDAFDPKQNVDAGARLLKQLLKTYGGDVSLALGAFNAGPGKVNQAGGVPDYPETLDYVEKVLSALPLASR